MNGQKTFKQRVKEVSYSTKIENLNIQMAISGNLKCLKSNQNK